MVTSGKLADPKGGEKGRKHRNYFHEIESNRFNIYKKKSHTMKKQ